MSSLPAAPTFAVVMTVKNARPWIDEAIASLLPALGTSGEIVVVDAASTDGTTEHLRALAERLPLRLRVEPCSMGRGRHTGILATGAPTVLTQVDADVRYRPEALSRGLEALRRHPGHGLVIVLGLHDADPDGTKLYVWDRAFYLSTEGYPDTNVGDDVVAVRRALTRGKVHRCAVDHVGEDLRAATRSAGGPVPPWRKGPGFLRLSRRRYAQGWTWRAYVRYLWVTRRTLPRFLAGTALAPLGRRAPAA